MKRVTKLLPVLLAFFLVSAFSTSTVLSMGSLAYAQEAGNSNADAAADAADDSKSLLEMARDFAGDSAKSLLEGAKTIGKGILTVSKGILQGGVAGALAVGHGAVKLWNWIT